MERRIGKNRETSAKHAAFCAAPTKIGNGEWGFAYVETIWYLFLFMLLLPSLFFLSHTFDMSIKEGMEKERLQMEWMAFVPQLERDVRQGTHFRLQDGSLIIDLDSQESVRYELNDRRIIRSVKNKGATSYRGTTLVLQDVYYAMFLPEPRGVMVDIGMQGWHTHRDFALFLAKRSSSP